MFVAAMTVLILAELADINDTLVHRLPAPAPHAAAVPLATFSPLLYPRLVPARANRSRPLVTPAPRPRPAARRPRAAVGAGSGLHWSALRQCESSGDYSAVSGTGKFRGAYQFSRSTWATVGSPGDPAAASPAEQDRRARLLYARDGRQPWPVCGRLL